jgi:trigger factor
VEVAPEIKIKNYKGLKLNYKKIEVTTDDLKRNMDSLKETHKVDSLDDNFAKGLGYPNVSQLQEAIQRQLFIQKDNQERQRIEADIIDGIIKDLDFKLPQSLIARHLKEMIRQAKVDLALRGLPKEEIDKQEASLEKELTPRAEKQVRVYLVLAEIAKKENITLDDHMTHKVMEFLLKQADWQESS